MEIYDLHCHIDLMPSMVSFASETNKAGIGIFAVTTTPKAYEKEITMLKQFDNIKVGLGLHPQLVSERYGELSLLEQLIGSADYIGEIGLDFNKKFYASKEKQIEVFELIIKWCSNIGKKTISIHSVHSDKTMLDILEKHDCVKKNKCILHWFSGTQVQLHRAVQMGCFFSINGAMIKSPNGRKLIKNIPSENILIETDAPFVKEIKTVKKMKAEILEIELALALVFTSEIISLIHTRSKAFLSV